MTTRFRMLDSPLGPLRLGADSSGRLTEVRVGEPCKGLEPGHNTDTDTDNDTDTDTDIHTAHEANTHILAEHTLDEAETQLGEYFEGMRRFFDVPLAMVGSAFQRQVWAQLLEIPFGTTVSYGQVAAQLGRSGAARAVGHANARNPIAVIVPCHRVVGASGQLTGYGGGLEAKRRLLDLEARGDPRCRGVSPRHATSDSRSLLPPSPFPTHPPQ